MSDNFLSVFYLVNGEATPLSMKIPSSNTVNDLKNLIVGGDQAPGFRDVAAKDLILWLVSIPEDIWGSAITIDALGDKTELNNPRTRLSKLFPESPDDNTYIIVRRPPQGNAMCFP
jgi:hypothetical protein